MFVSIQSNPVTQPVREIFVIWSVPAVRHDLASRIIDGTREPSGPCRVKSGILRLSNNFVNSRHFLRRLPENSRPRHVGSVPIHAAAPIDQHHVSFFQLLRLDGAVRQRRRCAQQNQRPAVQTHFRETPFYQLADVLL